MSEKSFLGLPWGKKADALRTRIDGLEAKERGRQDGGKDGLSRKDQGALDHSRVALRRKFLVQVGGGAGLVLTGTAGAVFALLDCDEDEVATYGVSRRPPAPEALDKEAFRKKLFAAENGLVALTNKVLESARAAGYSEERMVMLTIPVFVVEVNRKNARRFELPEAPMKRRDLLDYDDEDSFFFFNYGVLQGGEQIEFAGLYKLVDGVLKLASNFDPNSVLDLLTLAHELRHDFDIAKKLVTSAQSSEGANFVEDFIAMQGDGRRVSFLETELAAFATEMEMINALSKGEIAKKLSGGGNLSLSEFAGLLGESRSYEELVKYAGGEVREADVLSLLSRALREGKFKEMKGFKLMVLFASAKRYYSEGPNEDCSYPLTFAKMVAMVYSHDGTRLVYEGQDGRAHEIGDTYVITKEFLAGMREPSCLPRK